MKIAVAVSGGVDSLLSLVLLKNEGHRVMAVHGHFLPPGPAWERVRQGLSETCAALGVEFHALDLHQEFEARVVAPFVADYVAGLTPNPCAMCNPRMKFGALFRAAEGLGADRLATGHYVRLERREPWGEMLVRGVDSAKDQSYFLSLVPIETLRRSVFPLAESFKRDVPALLAEHGLTPPLPSESQEICFVPNDDYQAFLEQRGGVPGPGAIRLEDGTLVGRHDGLWRHTQGQRRGLGVSWAEPLYVLDKDVVANELVVGTKDRLPATGCVLRDINIMVDPAQWPDELLIQTRYRQQAKPGGCHLEGDRFILDFHEPQTRPTPGQVGAVYSSTGVVLAGGIIV